MIAWDVRITTMPRVTTYAQAMEKALTAESTENKIWHDSAARRDTRRVGPPFLGTDRGEGPSDQKRKAHDAFPAPGILVGRQGGSEAWRTFHEYPRCKRLHIKEC